MYSQKQKFDQIREIKFQIKNFNTIYSKIGKDGKIMNAYYERTSRTAINNHSHGTQIGDGLISFICMIVAFFTSAAAIRVEKTLLCTASFIAFFGVIGSMESGAIGLFGGLMLCALFSFVEYLVLKSMIKSKKASK